MGLQLEASKQSSFEQYGPWHFRDVRFKQDTRVELEAALFHTATIPDLNDRFLDISKGGRADGHSQTKPPEIALSVSKPTRPAVQHLNTAPSAPITTTATGKTNRPACLVTAHPALVFTQVAPSGQEVVTFPLQQVSAYQKPCLKRRRPDTDVDGPNTASSCCKKRRLLRQLVTSRLSRPFSLPATHILTREAVATGDKRFVKLAAIMSTRRLNSAAASHAQGSPAQQPSPSTWLRRAAVINSFRLRVCAEAAERGIAQATELAVKAAAFHQSHGSGAFVGGRFLVNAASRPSGAATPGISPPPPKLGPPASGVGSRPPAAGSCPGSQAGGPTSTVVRIPSPQLRPMRSPELRVTRPGIALEDLTDLDDDDVAFPSSEHESRYDDEPEDVYADFGVIFGGGEAGSTEDDAGDHYEDYMDDLDGIPWNVRC
ncbi:hypothetical protein MMYC01_201219 [Madurella mycetomatis]|uniref:Uncharacterized protein n=1 Tax=Madurella mycetomatis TaxID=100816 RepID=A0A175WHX4_9PEZI|nr:hypothetical protein MMYC01_201219 [Madurella mycetomatis]